MSINSFKKSNKSKSFESVYIDEENRIIISIILRNPVHSFA